MLIAAAVVAVCVAMMITKVMAVVMVLREGSFEKGGLSQSSNSRLRVLQDVCSASDFRAVLEVRFLCYESLLTPH